MRSRSACSSWPASQLLGAMGAFYDRSGGTRYPRGEAAGAGGTLLLVVLVVVVLVVVVLVILVILVVEVVEVVEVVVLAGRRHGGADEVGGGAALAGAL